MTWRASGPGKDKAVHELSATRDAIYDLEGQLSALNSAVSEKGENEQFELTKHIESIKGGLGQRQSRIDFVTKEAETLESQKRKVFIEVNALKQKHEALQSDLRSEAVRRASLSSELEEQEQDLNALKEQLATLDENVTQARDELFEKRKMLGEEKDKRGDVVRARDRVPMSCVVPQRTCTRSRQRLTPCGQTRLLSSVIWRRSIRTAPR